MTAPLVVLKKRESQISSKGRATAVVALLPFILFLLVFALYPISELIRLSFMQSLIVAGEFTSTFNGLDNFRKLIEDPLAIKSAKVTLVFTIFCVIFTLFFGICGALLVDKSRILRGVALNIFVWPAVIAPVVVSVMWVLILDPTVGALNKVLNLFGEQPQVWLNTPTGAFISIVIVDVWHWTPVVFLFIYAGLKGINGEILEAAKVDGANGKQIFRGIQLPILMPTIAVIGLLRIIMSIKAFDEMYLLTRGGPDYATALISLHIRHVFIDVLDFGYASAISLSIVFILVLIVLIILTVRSLGRWSK